MSNYMTTAIERSLNGHDPLAVAAEVPDAPHPVTFTELADDGRHVRDLPAGTPFGGIAELERFSQRLAEEYVRRTRPAPADPAAACAERFARLRDSWGAHMRSRQAVGRKVATVANAWMRNRQEELLFATEAQTRPRGQARLWRNVWIEPEAANELPVESNPPGVSLSTAPGGRDGGASARVDPRLIPFLTELRRRFPHVSYASYPGHGSQGFARRGLSIDMYVNASTTPRHFWDRDRVAALFEHIDATAVAQDFRFFAIYNDFAVARWANARLRNGSVGFAGSVDRGGGLNYHGGGLKLHVHIDLLPPALIARDNPAGRPGAAERARERAEFLRTLRARRQPAAQGLQTVPGTAVTFRSSAEIDAYFQRRTGRNFLDWFHATQANRGAWAGHSVLRDADTRRRFATVWDRIPEMFETPTITLEQFVALQGIFITELGGGMAPISEAMGRRGHPGMAYLFDSIPGVKQSYNHAPNRTAFDCFNDPEFIAAHGRLEPGPRLARTTDRAWAGEAYPAGQPTRMAEAPFIAQADFCKFRGRGMIQTTWRSGYRAILGFIRSYTGTNAKVLDFKRRWATGDIEQILTRSSNEEWDDLFQNSDYVIPFAGIRLHNRARGGYLSISTDPAVRAGTGAGSFHRVGARINGGQEYARRHSRRCIQILDALAAATPAPSTAPATQPATTPAAPPPASGSQPASGPPPSSTLRWPGATAEQLAFMRQVYDAHVQSSARRRAFVAEVPAANLREIPGEGGARAVTAASLACETMLREARAALARAQAAGDPAATSVTRIWIVSAYRSVSEQFTNWQGAFPNYYAQTADARRAADGGEHGRAAVDRMVAHYRERLAAPGYSLHNNGLAIDFGTRQGGRNLGASVSQGAAWRASWLYAWLTANAAAHGFVQSVQIEPWHWEFRGTPPRAQGLAGIASTLAVEPGSFAVASLPLLARHHDRPPDLFLRWNAIPDPAAGVDVVVHLHGFSDDRHLVLTTNKLPLSGLDFSPPTPPASDDRPHPPWVGRTRPTLLVLPRGMARPGHRRAYDFPALVDGNGFEALVTAALRQFEAQTGTSGRIPHRRIILTAHSGGGSALNRILGRVRDTPLDPAEVHVFDALYGDPAGVRGWMDRRLARDIERLRSGAQGAEAECGALRIFYTHGQGTATTEPHSVALHRRAQAAIPVGAPFAQLLARRYRAELSGVSHRLVAYWYGGRLLADAGQNVPRR